MHCILAGDADGAGLAMRRHLDDVARAMLAVLREPDIRRHPRLPTQPDFRPNQRGQAMPISDADSLEAWQQVLSLSALKRGGGKRPGPRGA